MLLLFVAAALVAVASAAVRSPKKAQAGKIEDLNFDFGGLNLGNIMCQVWSNKCWRQCGLPFVPPVFYSRCTRVTEHGQ